MKTKVQTSTKHTKLGCWKGLRFDIGTETHIGTNIEHFQTTLKAYSSSSPSSSSFPAVLTPCSLLLSHSVDASASQSGHSAANARKRFTLQGLSNRRSLPAGKQHDSTHRALAYATFIITGIFVDTIVLIVCSLLSSSVAAVIIFTLVIMIIIIIVLNSSSVYLACVLSSSVPTLQSHNCCCPLLFPPQMLHSCVSVYFLVVRQISPCIPVSAMSQHNRGHISLDSPFSAFICSCQYCQHLPEQGNCDLRQGDCRW